MIDNCPCDPKSATGKTACPFTTLYWDFLERHEKQLAKNNRMQLQLKNVARKRESGELAPIRKLAGELRRKWKV